MLKRPHSVLLIILLFTGGVLLWNSSIWAKPPCETVRIFNGGDEGPIKVVFDPDTCEPIEVYICKTYKNNKCTDWGNTIDPEHAVLCICTVNENAPSETFCDDEDLQGNIYNPNLTVECHDIITAGPKPSGCPIWGSRSYLWGGDAYRR